MLLFGVVVVGFVVGFDLDLLCVVLFFAVLGLYAFILCFGLCYDVLLFVFCGDCGFGSLLIVIC